jgi:hypothetical protein
LAVLVALAVGTDAAPAAKKIKAHVHRGKIVSIHRNGQGVRLTIRAVHHKQTSKVVGQKNRQRFGAQKNARRLPAQKDGIRRAGKARTQTHTFTVTNKTRISAGRNARAGLRALHRGSEVAILAHGQHADQVRVLHHPVKGKKKFN